MSDSGTSGGTGGSGYATAALFIVIFAAMVVLKTTTELSLLPRGGIALVCGIVAAGIVQAVVNRRG